MHAAPPVWLNLYRHYLSQLLCIYILQAARLGAQSVSTPEGSLEKAVIMVGARDLDPVNKAVKPLGLGNLQRVHSLEVRQGDQGTPQEGRGDCLRIAVGAAQEVPRGLTAARRPDELVQDLIRKITTRSIDA